MKHIVRKATVDGIQQREALHRAATQVAEAAKAVPGLVTLTPRERKRLTKMRAGAERYIQSLADAAARDPRFCPSGVDPAATRESLDAASNLEEFHAALVTALKSVEDTILFKQSHAYTDALDIYALIESHARREPALHAMIAPIEQFLSTGPRPKSSAEEPAPAADGERVSQVTKAAR